ncbi:MAG: hypothetical protein HY080_16920 [Gammaproteobacteria bacterium]|nr:hypothetical protein [Gammaproteobacteria bacterium]
MVYPSPEEVGVRVPTHLKQQDFYRGFEWALRGKQITQAEHLRLSFRSGYRAGKLYLNQLRRAQGIIPFPMKAQLRLR